MRSVDEQREMVLEAFIEKASLLDDAMPAYVKVLGADQCLRLATMAVQPEIMRTLIRVYGANVHQVRLESSDRHANGSVKRSLMDEVVDSLLRRPDIDRGQAYAAVNLLAELDVGVLINMDPIESPMMGAHLLAFPQMAEDKNTPHYDMIAGTVLEENPRAFQSIYAFFKGRFPYDTNLFEKALEDEKTRLRTEFIAAQRAEEETAENKPRSAAKAAAHLVFSTLDKK